MSTLVDIKINQMAWAQYIMDHKDKPKAPSWELAGLFVCDAYRERVKNILYTLAQYPPETVVKMITEAREWEPR